MSLINKSINNTSDKLTKMSPEKQLEYALQLLNEKKTVKQAQTILLTLANGANADAQYYLWKIFSEGKLVDKNMSAASTWLKASSNNGHTQATFELGMIYFNKGNYTDAKICFENLHNQLLPTSDIDIITQFEKSFYKIHNRLMELLAYKPLSNYPSLTKASFDTVDIEYRAITMLGIMYYEGRGVNTDYNKALEFFRMAAAFGDTEAHYQLGLFYSEGKSTQQDTNKAITHLKLASINEHLEAKFHLAKLLLKENKYEQSRELFIELINEESGEKIIENYLAPFRNNNTQPWTSEEIYICCELAKCYLDLYFTSLPDNKRTEGSLNKINKYKNNALDYINLSKNHSKNVLTSEESSQIEKSFTLYEAILSDDRPNITYSEFKKYEGTYSLLYNFANKFGTDVNSAIETYFNRRNSINDLFNKHNDEKAQLLKKHLPDITDKLLKKGYSEDKITNALQKRIENKKSNTKSQEQEIDFSDCMTPINKFVEELIYTIFVKEFNEYPKYTDIPKTEEEFKSITKNDSGIQILFNVLFNNKFDDKCDLNTYRNWPTKEYKEYCEFQLKQILTYKFEPSKINKTIQQIQDFLNSNPNLMVNEKKFIKNYSTLCQNRLNEFNKQKDGKKYNSKHFNIGELFEIIFIQDPNSKTTRKILNKDIVDFIKTINQTMDNDKIETALFELMNKIEIFRICARNKSSHKSLLSQESYEKGLFIFILQENSIMELVHNLFGEYIKNKFEDIEANEIERNILETKLQKIMEKKRNQKSESSETSL